MEAAENSLIFTDIRSLEKIGRRPKPPTYTDILLFKCFFGKTRRPMPAARTVGLTQFGEATPLEYVSDVILNKKVMSTWVRFKKVTDSWESVMIFICHSAESPFWMDQVEDSKLNFGQLVLTSKWLNSAPIDHFPSSIEAERNHLKSTD